MQKMWEQWMKANFGKECFQWTSRRGEAWYYHRRNMFLREIVYPTDILVVKVPKEMKMVKE